MQSEGLIGISFAENEIEFVEIRVSATGAVPTEEQYCLPPPARRARSLSQAGTYVARHYFAALSIDGRNFDSSSDGCHY
jgi:hypothetical protein